MKRTLAWLLTLVLCLTACSAVAETKVSFFTGKIETIDLLNEIIDGFNAANPGIVVEQEYQNDASSIIKVKFASGEVPDVMTTYEQEFVDQGKRHERMVGTPDSLHAGKLHGFEDWQAVSRLHQHDHGRFLLQQGDLQQTGTDPRDYVG